MPCIPFEIFEHFGYGFVKVDHTRNVPFGADVFGWFGQRITA